MFSNKKFVSELGALFSNCNYAPIVCISSQSPKCPRKLVIPTPKFARQQKHGNEWRTVARSKLLHRPKRDYESGKERDRERGGYGRDMGGPNAMKDRRRSKQDDRSKHRTRTLTRAAPQRWFDSLGAGHQGDHDEAPQFHCNVWGQDQNAIFIHQACAQACA